MKKNIIKLIIFLIFLMINRAYCQEDFFIDTYFEEAKNSKPKYEKKVDDIKEKLKENKEEKKGFFARFKKQDKKFNYSTNKYEEIPRGYYGKLPNIEDDFSYKKQYSKSSKESDIIVPDSEETQEENFQKAPFDDALFLDVIVKEEKSSTYVNDLQRVRYALDSLRKCIEQNEDIQRFNACVNVLDLYTKNLRTKYQNKPESHKESYIQILNSNYYAKELGNLKYDAGYYSKYIPVNDGKYSSKNIDLKEQALLNKVNKTLFLINQER